MAILFKKKKKSRNCCFSNEFSVSKRWHSLAVDSNNDGVSLVDTDVAAVAFGPGRSPPTSTGSGG